MQSQGFAQEGRDCPLTRLRTPFRTERYAKCTFVLPLTKTRPCTWAV